MIFVTGPRDLCHRAHNACMRTYPCERVLRAQDNNTRSKAILLAGLQPAVNRQSLLCDIVRDEILPQEEATHESLIP